MMLHPDVITTNLLAVALVAMIAPPQVVTDPGAVIPLMIAAVVVARIAALGIARIASDLEDRP
jgi:hypothetical protein